MMEWIKVEDGLPEDEQRILIVVVVEDRIYGTVRYVDFGHYRMGSGCFVAGEHYPAQVTHWAPFELPDFPSICVCCNEAPEGIPLLDYANGVTVCTICVSHGRGPAYDSPPVPRVGQEVR